MNEIDKISLPETEKLKEILELVKRNDEASKYFKAKRIVPELLKGFEEISRLTNESIFVEIANPNESFIVRDLAGESSIANNYIHVNRGKSSSEAIIKIRVRPDNFNDNEEVYYLSRNALNDAYILKPQNAEESSIIQSDIILDDLFFEKVIFEFLKAVYEARQI